MNEETKQTLLNRVAPYINLPQSLGLTPETLEDGSGLRCQKSGKVFPYRDGILDLIEEPLKKTITQKTLDTNLTAWAYDLFRNSLVRLLQVPKFSDEVDTIQKTLNVQPGDVILDLACGPGNFTIEWAKRAKSLGLIIGLDLSIPMLQRASTNIRKFDLDNVILIHGDAQKLPFVDHMVNKVNCSGGFHQFPDLERALKEIARVINTDGGILTASTFAEKPGEFLSNIKRWSKRVFSLHFVQLDKLCQRLDSMGFVNCEWSLPNRWFGYVSAMRKVGHNNANSTDQPPEASGG